jgi:nifR3 family TIM-barrel protein
MLSDGERRTPTHPMIPLHGLMLPLVVQSPMANCTDLPFRLIARSQGMAFAYLEMVSSDALVRGVQATINGLMQTVPEDRPLGAQIVGSDPAVMGEAAARVEAMGFDLLDMNFGCPVPKVVCKGGGSMLLKEPRRAEAIFRRVVKSVKRIPVTVKMRLGFCDGSGQEAAAIAKLAEDAGISAVAVHGRTREQGYSGAADYAAIGRIKAAVSIPVLGNGDVVDGKSALRLREVSGCDGVMLGRGALGNPWIYRDIDAALAGQPAPARPALEVRKRLVRRHLELQCRYEARPIGHLRRIVPWYFKDMPGVSELRDRMNRAQTIEEMLALIDAFSDALPRVPLA